MRWFKRRQRVDEQQAIDRIRAAMQREYDLLNSVCGSQKADELFHTGNTLESLLVDEVVQLKKQLSVCRAQHLELSEMLSSQRNPGNE